MKQSYSINNVYYDMVPNSQFAVPELRDRLNTELDKIVKRYYIRLQNPEFDSSVGYDYYGFQLCVYLRDLFGGGLSYYAVNCGIKLGKGKKNLGNNNLSLYPTICFRRSDDSDKEYEAAFNSLNNRLETELPEDNSTFTNSSELVDALMGRINVMTDRMNQLLKDEWVRMHNERTSRDIDFIGYISEIKEIFKAAGADVKIEEENGLDKGSIDITPADDDLVGRLRLECTDGRWHIEAARYTFGFVSDIFDMESGYSTRRYIRDGKLLEVIKIIAEEYVRQDRIRSAFMKVAGDYVEAVDENK